MSPHPSLRELASHRRGPRLRETSGSCPWRLRRPLGASSRYLGHFFNASKTNSGPRYELGENADQHCLHIKACQDLRQVFCEISACPAARRRARRRRLSSSRGSPERSGPQGWPTGLVILHLTGGHDIVNEPEDILNELEDIHNDAYVCSKVILFQALTPKRTVGQANRCAGSLREPIWRRPLPSAQLAGPAAAGSGPNQYDLIRLLDRSFPPPTLSARFRL